MFHEFDGVLQNVVRCAPFVLEREVSLDCAVRFSILSLLVMLYCVRTFYECLSSVMFIFSIGPLTNNIRNNSLCLLINYLFMWIILFFFLSDLFFNVCLGFLQMLSHCCCYRNLQHVW